VSCNINLHPILRCADVAFNLTLAGLGLVLRNCPEPSTLFLFALSYIHKNINFTGNGAGFTKLFERLIRGVWTPTAMEFMQPSL
jgi:hypothetical protein